MIFAAATFFHLVNLKQLPMVLSPFLTFQLKQWNALPDFFITIHNVFNVFSSGVSSKI